MITLAVSSCHNYSTNIQSISNMQTPTRIINKWKSVKEYGYVQELSVITGKTCPTVSRILAGKQGTTPDVMLKIQEFLKQKEKVQKSVLTSDQD